MTGMMRALRLIAWLGARAAAPCSAPSSVWPRRPVGFRVGRWLLCWDPLRARGDWAGTCHWTRSSLCGWEGNEQRGNTAAGLSRGDGKKRASEGESGGGRGRAAKP